MIKDLTRTNSAINQERFHAFVDGLAVSDEVKMVRKNVTPFNYVAYR